MTWFASPGRRGEAAGRRRLPRRPGHRHDGLPRRRAREAAAGRGSGRRRQDRAGQGGRPRDGRRPGAAAVLRGPRRGAGALRVELQEAAAAHPGRAGRRPVVGGDPRRHLHRRVPADPAAADRDPARASRRCCSSTRSTRPTSRSRGCCSRCSRDFQVTIPELGTVGRRTPPVRGAHLQRDPRAVRGGQAALPLPAPRLPRRRARARDRALAGARPRRAARRPARRRRSAGCATSS